MADEFHQLDKALDAARRFLGRDCLRFYYVDTPPLSSRPTYEAFQKAEDDEEKTAAWEELCIDLVKYLCEKKKLASVRWGVTDVGEVEECLLTTLVTSMAYRSPVLNEPAAKKLIEQFMKTFNALADPNSLEPTFLTPLGDLTGATFERCFAAVTSRGLFLYLIIDED